MDMPFNPAGSLKPVILVGRNGSGKTNLISIKADALFEAAAKHFQNVTQRSSGLSRPWFRYVGASTITLGSATSLSLLRFEHGDQTLFF